MNSLYNINKESIKTNPKLCNLFYSLNQIDCLISPTSIKYQNAKYDIIATPSSLPTLIITEENGKTITYHSRYNPYLEAEKQVSNISEKHSYILVFGTGLAYNLEVIFKKIKEKNIDCQILVIEPDPKVFKLALEHRNLSSILSDQRFIWCVAKTPDEVGDIWLKMLDWSTLDELIIIEHPPTVSRFFEYFSKIKEKIRFQSNKSKSNLVTMMKTGYQFHTNSFRNIIAIATFPGIQRLFNQFTNIPAVVVAAGPSLEKNIELLKQVEDNFLIIATDTVFRPMIAHGIKPHLVCAGDPSYLNSLDFVGVENITDVWLVMEPMTSPDIQRNFKGPKFVASFGGGLPTYLEQFREPIGKLTCWGSIATTAFDLAKQAGCNPIIFIGLDLSYKHDRIYIRGSYSDDVFYDKVHEYTSLEQEILEFIIKRTTHKYTMPNGEVLFSDENMFLYKNWFEDQLQQIQRTVINATEGGVLTNYVELMPLSEVIKKYYSSSISSIRQQLAQLHSSPVKSDIIGIKNFLEINKKKIIYLKDESNKCLQKLKKISKTFKETLIINFYGPDKEELIKIQKFHDIICTSQPIINWFNSHQAKFITKHGMEINKLSINNNATVNDWITALSSFFNAFLNFTEFQLPLINEAIEELANINSQTYNIIIS